MNGGDAVRGSAILLVAAVLLTGCGESTSDQATQAVSAPARGPDARILGVENGAECNRDVVSHVPYDFRLKLKIHGENGNEFSFDYEKTDGSVDTASGLSATFDGNGQQLVLSTGLTTFDVQRIIVHARGETGIGGSCVITLASASQSVEHR